MSSTAQHGKLAASRWDALGSDLSIFLRPLRSLPRPPSTVYRPARQALSCRRAPLRSIKTAHRPRPRPRAPTSPRPPSLARNSAARSFFHFHPRGPTDSPEGPPPGRNKMPIILDPLAEAAAGMTTTRSRSCQSWQGPLKFHYRAGVGGPLAPCAWVLWLLGSSSRWRGWHLWLLAPGWHLWLASPPPVCGAW